MASPEQAALGIKPGSPMAEPRSKIRLVCAVKRIWLISAIPTATSSVRFIGRPLPEFIFEGRLPAVLLLKRAGTRQGFI